MCFMNLRLDEEASGFSLACTICDKQFASNEVLKRHMKTHIGSSCHLCLQTFKVQVIFGYKK